MLRYLMPAIFFAAAAWSIARTVRRLEGNRPSMTRRVLNAAPPVIWVLLGVATLALAPQAGFVLVAVFVAAMMFRVLWWAVQRAEGGDGWEPPEPPPAPKPRQPRQKEFVLPPHGRN